MKNVCHESFFAVAGFGGLLWCGVFKHCRVNFLGCFLITCMGFQNGKPLIFIFVCACV